jgi:Variant SH3 domain
VRTSRTTRAKPPASHWDFRAPQPEWVEWCDQEFCAPLTEPRANLCVQALFSYNSDSPHQLSFEEADIIQVFEEGKDGWYYGRKWHDAGWFPSTLCALLSDPTAITGGLSSPAMAQYCFDIRESLFMLRKHSSPSYLGSRQALSAIAKPVDTCVKRKFKKETIDSCHFQPDLSSVKHNDQLEFEVDQLSSPCLPFPCSILTRDSQESLVSSESWTNDDCSDIPQDYRAKLTALATTLVIYWFRRTRTDLSMAMIGNSVQDGKVLYHCPYSECEKATICKYNIKQHIKQHGSYVIHVFENRFGHSRTAPFRSCVQNTV